MSDTSKNFRIDDQNWQKFKKICKANDTNASQELRKFIAEVNSHNNLNYSFSQTSIYNYIQKGK